ncbi:MAG: acyltransferase [Oscillospiraceae bacterium]|nr:acyltransferase [Oscillospiraceae bacterium]
MPDLLLLGFAAICLWGLRPVKPFRAELNTDCLLPETTTCVRGMMALLVIFVHIAQMNPAGPVFAFVGKMGNMAVSVFFFLSGYALQTQHMTRPDYAKGFLRKRLLTMVLPYILVTALYWVYYLWLGKDYDLTYVLRRFATGNPLASFSWYMVAALVLHLSFWVMMRLCGKRYKAMLWCAVVWFVMYTAACVALKFGFWWYVSSFSAVAGMFWAVYREKIEALLRKHYFWIAGAAIGCLGVLFALDCLINVAVLGTVLKGIAAVAFAVTLMVLLHKFRFGNPVLYYLGQMSMELYLMHGMAMMVIRNRVIFIQNQLLYCALIVPVTVLLAGILYIAFKGLPKKKPTR